MHTQGHHGKFLGRQVRHSGGHIAGALALPPLCYILQNPGKTQVLLILPPVVALILHALNLSKGSFFKRCFSASVLSLNVGKYLQLKIWNAKGFLNSISILGIFLNYL